MRSRGVLAIYARVSRVPPHASSGKDHPEANELEQLEELGDDAIIAHQQGAHAPKPRAQVTEEARSVVISDHPPVGSNPPPAAAIPAAPEPKKRRERSEKTVVIRDRRQIDQLRKAMAKRQPSATGPMPALWLWVAVGVAAFLLGGLVALFATRGDDVDAAAPVRSALIPSPPPPDVPAAAPEPPQVSIDELPVEGSKSGKK